MLEIVFDAIRSVCTSTPCAKRPLSQTNNIFPVKSFQIELNLKLGHMRAISAESALRIEGSPTLDLNSNKPIGAQCQRFCPDGFDRTESNKANQSLTEGALSFGSFLERCEVCL